MNRTPNPRTTTAMGSPIRRGLLALAGLALIGLASSAVAQDTGSAGIVLEKDATAKTLTLANGTVLQVSSRTVITGVEGQRIGFDAIPAAAATGDGGFEVDGDEGILYEADLSRGSARANRIKLLESIPD